MDALGVDTRSDVYSLGVLLYELMTDSTPLERGRLREAGYVEILKRIKEEEPPTPSTRLTRSKETLSSVAAHRKTEPAKLAKSMRGELDWIVMKALEKDRTRRYETPNSLARDITNFLNDEPVEACPPSTRYRLSKLARKHRAALATVAMIAMFLTVGAGVSAWQAFRATRAERLAESRLRGCHHRQRPHHGSSGRGKQRARSGARRTQAGRRAGRPSEGPKVRRPNAPRPNRPRF